MAIDIDLQKKTITIADTYRELSLKPRIFSLNWFKTRWWDTAYYYNSQRQKIVINPHHFIFVIANKNVQFPQKLHLQPATELPSLIESI